jgi:hypothetical protein
MGKQPTENEQLPLGIGHDASEPHQLPAWCNVYAGLTDKQIAEIEEVLLQRADLTRVAE